MEMMKEGNKSSPVHDYLIPVRLVVMQEPQGANETVPFHVQPKLMMVDKLNRTVRTLGHGNQGQWYVVLSHCLLLYNYRPSKLITFVCSLVICGSIFWYEIFNDPEPK